MTVTNKTIQNIHLFATGDLFNANKSSLTDADIALVKATGVTNNYDLGNIIDSSLGEENGYIKYSNGLIIQWMKHAHSEDSDDYKYFPISFPNECYIAISSDCWHQRSEDDKKYVMEIIIMDNTKMLCYEDGTPGGNNMGIIAIGH